MDQLLKDQFKTYERMEELQKKFKETPCSNSDEITARKNLILKHYQHFCEKDKSIDKIKHTIDTSSEEYFKQNLPFKCEDLHLELLSANKLAENQQSRSEGNQRAKNEMNEKKSLAEELPITSVKKFSGKSFDWITFREEFHRLVISKSYLTDSRKFELLKSALPKDIPLTSYNEVDFIQAWNRLDEIFKNVIVTGTLKEVIKHRGCNNSKAIFELLEKTIEYLNELESFNIIVHDRDGLFINVLVTKLTENTKIEWFDTFSYPDSPQLYDFLKFLNSKVVKKSLSGEIEKFNNYASCVCCEVKHPLWQCEKFKSMNNDKNLDFLRDKAICRRCLSSTHVIAECQEAYTCRICLSRDHHYLLHKEN